jgi:hypothetical protein
MRAPLYPDDEARVVAAFGRYLAADGWEVVRSRPSRNEPDVVAVLGTRRLVAEAKGRTMAARTDIDTMYGQILRRIEPGTDTHYAVVVPTAFVARALDVTPAVRETLRIRVSPLLRKEP